MRTIGMAYGPTDRIVIVGAGPAGWAAAEELRRLGFPGGITVLGEEPQGPYDRTACSKGLLNGHQKPSDISLDRHGCVDVDWRLGRRAMWLDPATHAVVTDTGETFPYDGLVVATGARPVIPAGWPAGEPGLFVLHGVEDAWTLRTALRNARRVAVVGGGLTGTEVACAVFAMARESVVINSQRALMSRVLGEPVGALVTDSHRAAGVDMRLGRRVQGVDRGRGRWRLRLDDGEDVHADVVVVAAGDRPDVEWLDGVGIDLGDGVLCDPSLRVAGTSDAVAAGVVARWPNLRYSAEPRRVGHWIAAMEQGQAAARTLLTGQHANEPFTLLPRFWSEQLGLRIQVCGQVAPDAEVAVTEMRPGRRDTARGGVLASYYQSGRLTGVVAVNAPQAFTVASRTLVDDPAAAVARTTGVAPLVRRLHAAV
ncbi:MAG TPA: FAD/NAD(P)-binding oxidoreductase [Mycobacteriales bacterium]|nr:FAD/NAD(P)-binding oxidoreductase [Mycobacteriales bacterium]